MTTRETQHLLNHPFAFQEVLLSPKERSRIQKGPVAGQLFNTEQSRIEVTEYRLRELSVRLRTINNACDSMASLPDGTPLTEVSLYGSRDRQYLLGPYEAVRKVMTANFPSRGPLLQGLEEDKNVLSGAISTLESHLSRVTAGEQVRHVDLEFIVRRMGAPEVPTTPSNWGAVQIWPEDKQHLEAAITSMRSLAAELNPPIDEVKAWKHWWMPWTEDVVGIRSQSKQAAQAIANRAALVIAELQERVFAPG